MRVLYLISVLIFEHSRTYRRNFVVILIIFPIYFIFFYVEGCFMATNWMFSPFFFTLCIFSSH